MNKIFDTKIKFISSIVLLNISVLFTFPAIAGQIYDATVEGIGIKTTASGQYVAIKIGDKTVVTAQPACATDNTYKWSFSTTSSEANMFLSLLVTAKTTGQKVKIIGTSTCTVTSTREDVLYVILTDGVN